MNSLHDRLIGQLDTLISFLALSREEVFETIQTHHSEWFAENEENALPESLNVYRTQVIHGAFLLGYSYAEAFLADLIREIYRARPEALPREKEVTFGDILARSNYLDLLNYMIDRQVVCVMYNSMEEVIKFFEKRLKINWPSNRVNEIIESSLLRNCIIHNNSRADSRLAEHARWSDGEAIELTASNVHQFGLSARAVARSLFEQANARFFTNLGGNA